MFRRIINFCFLLGLLLCVAEQASAKSKKGGSMQPPAVIIHNAEQFNRHLEDIATNMQERTICVFRHEQLINSRNFGERSVWYDYGNSYQTAIYPKQIAEITFHFKDNARLLAAHLHPELLPQLTEREQQALRIAQQRVSALIHPGMTDTQKLRALHDDLVNRSRYTREQKGSVSDLLLEGRGTCEAYSRTLWLLCRMSGLPCHIVYGDTKEPHAWNLICIDGQWYHTDATWNDPVTAGRPDIQTLSHRYFMLDDKRMAKDHKWASSHLPAATVHNADFFRRRHLYFTEDAPLWEALSAAITQGQGSLEVYMQDFRSDASLRRRLREAAYRIPALQAVTSWQGPGSEPAGIVHFRFENSASPGPANMKNLDFSDGILVETRRLINSIDTESLKEQWDDFSDSALSWWEQFLRLLQELLDWILSLFRTATA